MKLKNELPTIRAAFEPNEQRIKQYAAELRASGEYNDFVTRLTWDCLRAFVTSETICTWYNLYNCHDSHIQTAAVAVLKELNVL